MAEQPSGASGIAAIVAHLEALADRLDDGSQEDHVRRSVAELARAVAGSEPVGPAVNRVMSSIGQLQTAERTGPRRHQQQSQLAIERVLDALQQDLVPELQRSNRM